MAYIYEEVGEKNRELWESIGWKNWGERKVLFSKYKFWSFNREKQAYLIAIGGFMDTPYYYDFSYEGRIVRMEVICSGEGNVAVGAVFHWKIEKMYIPKSLWKKREEVIEQIISAFSVVRNAFPIEKVKKITAEVRCEPECVEADYNGR